MASLTNPGKAAWKTHDPRSKHDDIRFVTEQFNDIFRQLSQIFPGFRASIKTQDDLNTMRQQWVLAMVEGGIRTREQIDRGLSAARTADTDFLPSCGRFVSWCNSNNRSALGLPTDDEVMAEFRRYAKEKYRFSSAEYFNWSHPVMYWVVLDVRRMMYQNNFTDSEVLRSIKKHMHKWERELKAGRRIPAPVKQLTDKRRPPAVADILDPSGSATFRASGKAFLARIRAQQHGGK
ncbi:replication protein P [Pantoea stewartii]|uniref:replication protein P n=1 Tax=Pantoea stewartii TaxID=66269 RepID=UPI00138FC4FA|nr:replication protein P [Pantoea stewartii]